MNSVNDLLTRGVANIIPNREGLKKRLESGDSLNIYLGIDPTSPNIHLGHAVVLRKLKAFSELGNHNVTLVVGDFTATIGDTSDKESERPQLTRGEIENNLKTYKEQAGKILDLDKVKIIFNSKWLDKLSFREGTGLVSKFSLNDFISRELIKKRLNEGKRVGLLETIYPVMQGYDSFVLNTDIQIGGTDQTFNMQAGRALLKDKKESFIMSMEFLPGTDGRKMSKTWRNAIWLTDSPNDMFGKIMSISDEVIDNYLILATNLSMDEVEELKSERKSNPMEVKKKLAETIVEELYPEQAEPSREYFEKTVQKKEVPEEILEIKVKENISVLDVIVDHNLVDSRSEGKRLIEQGGVNVNEKRATLDLKIHVNDIIKVGKRKFAKVISD